MFEIQNLNMFTDAEKDMLNKNKANFRKIISSFLKESHNASKLPYCYYCGKETTSFCNSHLVPAFCLRNIASMGDVACLNALIDFPLMDEKKGVNEAGTFRIICRDCDGKIFSDYENPTNYENLPTPKMLAQIALKNNLKFISRRLVENELHKIMHSKLCLPESFYNSKQDATNLDLDEYIKGYQKAKRTLEKNWTGEYYLCYYKKLNYVAPIAFQDCIAMVTGFNGETINDVYNHNKKYELKYIHICVFPLKSETVIMMFVDNGDNRYRNFYKQLKKLPLEEQLSVIMFILFSYSQDVFFSKSVVEEAKSNAALVEASMKGQDIYSTTPTGDFLSMAKRNFDLSNRKNILNLLAEKYKLNM